MSGWHQNLPEMSALQFLQAAAGALPRTLGDRDRIAALDQAMYLAIDSGMSFENADAQGLKALTIRTTVGNFYRVSERFYRRACVMGGTYPRFYESQIGVPAWRAPRVHASTWLMSGPPAARYAFRREPVFEGRVAPGCGVLLPLAHADDTNDPLQRVQHGGVSYELWWCHALAADSITLLRYAPAPVDALQQTQAHDPDTRWRHPRGRPAARQVLSRGDWAALMQAAAPTEQATPAQRPRERATA